MGRNKSVKGKEKKQKWKEEQKKLTVSQELVNAANLVNDHLENLTAFQEFKRNGLEVTIDCKRRLELGEDALNNAFKITKINMESCYQSSTMGWSDKEKFNEMAEDNAWYLFAKDAEGEIVAICHFRFDLDENDEILYCYEIQLVEKVRGKGLGKFLMQILELICFRTKMKKVMLTVFKHNEKAMSFFTKLKYTVDETSPRYYDPLHPELYDYEILSKIMKKE